MSTDGSTKIKSITPLNGLVVVKPEKASSFTNGGIALPEDKVPYKNTGKVVAVSEGRRTIGGELIEPAVREGDYVMFQQEAFNLYTLEDGTKVSLIPEQNLLGVVN